VLYKPFSVLQNKKMLSASRVLCRQAKVLMKKLTQGSDESTYLRAKKLTSWLRVTPRIREK